MISKYTKAMYNIARILKAEKRVVLSDEAFKAAAHLQYMEGQVIAIAKLIDGKEKHDD